MSRVKNLSIFGIILITILGCALLGNPKAFTTNVNQSPQSGDGQTMQALLNEVRQLRMAIQRSNVDTYRAQVTIERLRLQQQRVERLNEKLEGVREKIADINSNQSRLKDRTPKAVPSVCI
jgi:hypothetical protein